MEIRSNNEEINCTSYETQHVTGEPTPFEEALKMLADRVGVNLPEMEYSKEFP